MNRKKSIAIISSQYFWLPQEAGPTRFYSIARIFQENGYDVTVITSSFEHHEKVQRDKSLSRPFKIIYIDCPAYKKNISFRRIISNRFFANGVKKVLHSRTWNFDAVYCSVPPNNISRAVGKYCHENRITFIADIEDLWPEAMRMIFDKPFISDILFYPYMSDAEKTYQYADAVVGTSEEYSLRASRYNGKRIPYKTVYVGCDINVFDREAEDNADKVKKPEREMWITYAGSIGHSYAIDNLIKAAKLIQNKGYDSIKFKILGTGPLKAANEELARKLKCKNVEFLGYVEHPLMAAILVKSDILVNSFAKGAPQSIVNKIGDYLAAGKPVINTLENKECCKLVNECRAGMNVEAENPRKLSEAILVMINDPEGRKKMGRKAREAAENKFDRKISYKEIVSLTEAVSKG